MSLRLLLFLLLSLALAFIAFQKLFNAENNNPFAIIPSPKQTYEVKLYGDPSRPRVFTNEVRFAVTKQGKELIPAKILHRGGSFDLSFEIGFPDYEWLHENALHFFRREQLQSKNSDSIVVSNKSTRSIKYLKIDSDDKSLIFDLDPQSRIQLIVAKPGGDYRWIRCEGEFVDGKHFQHAVNLPRAIDRREHQSYEISVDYDSVLIEMQDGVL